MIFDNILKSRINSNLTRINEDRLYKKYGDCSNISINVKLLIITDTHGYLAIKPELQERLKSITNYDLCCTLGDVTYSDYEEILKYVSKDKIVGLLGNHDGLEVLKHYSINDLNGRVVDVNGLKIGGIQGSFRYKNGEYPSFTHSESIDFLNKMEKVDILLSHSGPFWNYNDDVVHNGLKGITNYLYKNKVPLNIHGHLHKNSLKMLKNGTKVQCVYGVELLEIKDGEIKEFFNESSFFRL